MINPLQNTLRLLLLPVLLLPALFVHAQSPAVENDSETETEEPPQYYQVEMIVFRNLDQSRTTPEIPRMPEAELSEVLDQELARLSGTMPSESMADIPAEAGITDSMPQEAAIADGALVRGEEEDTGLPFLIEVSSEQLLLSKTARQIENLQAYELLSYLHWAQPAPDVTAARQLDLVEVGADPELLSGNIEVHQRRYLHMLIDVSLGRASKTGPGQNNYEMPLPGEPGTLPALKDSRRIRLEQLHYFDQPQFGVLAVISRYEFPGEDGDATP